MITEPHCRESSYIKAFHIRPNNKLPNPIFSISRSGPHSQLSLSQWLNVDLLNLYSLAPTRCYVPQGVSSLSVGSLIIILNTPSQKCVSIDDAIALTSTCHNPAKIATAERI